MSFIFSNMKYIKVRDVKSPNRGSELAAGIDFFVPKFNDELKKSFNDVNKRIDTLYHPETKEIEIKPQGRVLIPSGIKTYIEKDRMLLATNKSGITTKKGLTVGATLVDADYEGEIHLSLLNPTNVSVFIVEGDKVVQFMELQYFSTVEEIKENDFQQLHALRNTSRGEGGFGSTGDK